MMRPWAKVWDVYDYKCRARINHIDSMTIPIGYVGVPRSHPDYGKHYDNVDVEAPDGLTFSGPITTQGEPDDGFWYFGFDCGHSWGHDVDSDFRVPNKALEYVYAETEKLAAQLKTREEIQK